MKVSYYPGCSLEHSAKDYEESIEAVAGMLDVQLEEVPDWNCCGATAAHSINEDLALALPARNLVNAEVKGQDVVVPCALCFNRLKVAEHALLGPEAATLGLDYQGKIKVWDLLDYLTQDPVLAQIKEKLKKPLGGLKTVCYYGCVVARPPKITDRRGLRKSHQYGPAAQRFRRQPVSLVVQNRLLRGRFYHFPAGYHRYFGAKAL